MKQAAIIASLALSALSMSASAQAGTVGQAFNVTATLTTACASNNTGPADVAFGAYTSFTATALTANTTVSFKCTRNSATPTAATLTGGTGGTTGSIKGLTYTLVLGTATLAAGAAGAPDVYSYLISGTMAAGQAGDATAAPGPVVHTLTITY